MFQVVYGIFYPNCAKEKNMIDHPLKLLNFRTYPWVILGTFMLAGALFGYLVSATLKPIYEARSTLTANIEIVRNYPITEMMVDSQMTLIGSQVYDREVVEEVLEAENSVGNKLDYEAFRKNADFERQMMNTIFKYRDHDPMIAQRVANTWAEAFYKRLTEAYPYGLEVSEARATLQSIINCHADEKKKDTEFCLDLTAEREAALKDEANAVIQDKALLSMGLTSAFSIGTWIPADVPDAPIRFTRGSLILAGLALGTALGLLLIEILPGGKEIHAKISA